MRRTRGDASQAALAYELSMRRLRVRIAWLCVPLLASLLRTAIDGMTLSLGVADVVTEALLLSAIRLRRTGRRLGATYRGATRRSRTAGRSGAPSHPGCHGATARLPGRS